MGDNTTQDTVALVQEISDNKAQLLTPATIFIVVLMVSGLIGNSMVCFYYVFKAKMTTNSFFIVILAVYDLVVCSISMPTEIVDIVQFYTFENGVACKILRFVNYFAEVGSILTLVAIAVDRLRKLYKPLHRQMNMKMAKWVSVIIAGVSICLSWPSLVIYGAIKVNVPNSLNISLTGSDCTSTKDKSFRSYVWAFNITHFVLFFICMVTLIVLYGIIGKTIYKHSRQLSKYKVNNKLRKTENTELDEEASKSQNKVSENTFKADVKKSDASSASTSSAISFNTTDKASAIQKKTPTSIDNESIRITLVMIAITVLFVASFLPYLSLTVWRIKEGKHEVEFLSDAGLVGFKIGSRSFLLNSSLNPWIYGIFNSSFRNYFFGRCCRGSNRS